MRLRVALFDDPASYRPRRDSFVPSAIPPNALALCEAAARAGGLVLLDWVGRFAVSNKGPRDLVTEADVASQREIRRILLGGFPEHGFIGEETLPEHAADGRSDRAVASPPMFRWVVDPLDGTSNYVHGFPAWCVSVALALGDEILVGTVYDPVRDECFTAQRGGGAALNGRSIKAAGTPSLAESLVAVSFPPHVEPESPAIRDFLSLLPRVHSVRRSGSTALNLAWLACGRLDAFWVRRIACWDVAAGLLLVREAGGSVAGFAGGRIAAPDAHVPLDDPAFIAACSPQVLAELGDALVAG
jgi:myo-inositol-1(or 4)-monophosphatase